MSYASNDDEGILAQLTHIQDSIQLNQMIRVVNDNDSGHCEECGCEIPIKRLEAIPNAKYCVKCQEVYDKKIKVTYRNPYIP